LGDEYSKAGAISVALFADSFLNLQTKSLLLTGTAYDPDKIKWAWPRPIRIALLTAKPTATGQNFTLKLAKIAGGPFISGDVVQIRRAPLGENDPFAALRFKVTAVNSTDLVVANTGAQTFNPNLYDPLLKHVVVCVATTTTTPATPERKQVADPIMKRIRTHGPLTGPNCPDLLISEQEEMSPTSLPTLQKKPASPADIIGLYEGGAQQRCEVFRPAGRCKMRSGETDTVPFCQVCRYILVDKIDPLKLVVLDKLYDPDYPQ
jgi:hypothetical protein